MDDFEIYLESMAATVERYVRFRLRDSNDAEDVLQEVYARAFQHFSQLRDKTAFKSWILSIAKNQCADYYRKKGQLKEVSIEELSEQALYYGRQGIAVQTAVADTMERLSERDREILYLFYWKELPQADIACRLEIPVGTVKSRLHSAKRNFRRHYPYPPNAMTGDNTMRKLPDILPQYSIEEQKSLPFAVKWEELMGWFIIPRLGEKISWGMYDIPSRRCSNKYDVTVTGRAIVHGVEGVQISAEETSFLEKNDQIERTFIAQLTDTHCRYLAALRTEKGIKHYITFLDEEEFAPTWGFGDNNCGNETNIAQKGKITRCGNGIICSDDKEMVDIVGRYTVKINNQSFDTVRIMIIEGVNAGVFSEQYVDANGRTVLWRRFNRDDWAVDRFGGKKWSEQLPQNERLTVNGETYVHWYDCMSDYIL